MKAQCIYDISDQKHFNYEPETAEPLDYETELCEHCYMVKDKITLLCPMCGFHINLDGGLMKVCNDCYQELDQKREKEWLNG